MKRIISFFVLIITMHCSISIAQSQPVTFNPNILAHSQGLPNEFLLFSSDTSVQILFNPARAALTNKRFIYTNYTPGSSLPLYLPLQRYLISDYQYEAPSSYSPTLSVAALFNAYGSTWLFQFSNLTDNYTNDYTFYGLQSQQWFRIDNESSYYSYTSNRSVTAFKLSLIENQNRSSFSFGIFGIATQMDANTNRITMMDKYSQSTTSDMQTNDHTRNNLNIQNTYSRYTAGLEFTMMEKDWNLVTNITVQKNNIEGLLDYYTRRIYENWNSSSTIINREFSDDIKNFKTEPLIFGSSGYFHHKTDLITPLDHYFISTNFYYSGSELLYDQNGYEKMQRDRTGYNPSSDSVSYSLSRKANTTDIIAALSFGYLITHKLIDIDILVGVNPQLGYYQYNEASPFFTSDYYDYYGYSTFSTIDKHKVLSASIQIPIHLNFTPVNWCSFFGGLNYRYSFIRKKINSFQPQIEYYSSSNNSVDQQWVSEKSKNQTITDLSSSNNVFAGIELRHASGLRIQTAFRGNLSSYSSWNISLGYIY